MQVEIWVAILALFGTLTGSFAGILVANKLVNFRLEKLEEEVKKLSTLTERIAMTEYDIHYLKESIKHDYPLKTHTIQQTSMQ